MVNSTDLNSSSQCTKKVHSYYAATSFHDLILNDVRIEAYMEYCSDCAKRVPQNWSKILKNSLLLEEE
jgi:hypothetical protein